MPIYSLYSSVYLNEIEKCYRKIITINQKPQGPLATITKQIKNNRLSPFKDTYSACCHTEHCLYAITNINNYHELMNLNELANLFTFLSTNGYTIDTNLTKMMNDSNIKADNKNLICYISI